MLKIIFILILAVSVIDPSIAQKPAKNSTVSGNVTDANQNPVAGAMVMIDKQNTNIVTDKNGHYKVKARAGSLMISILTKTGEYLEAPIHKRTTIDFAVKGSALSNNSVQTKKEDEETVNIGYGTVKKKDLSTPVGKINGQEKRFASYTNIYEMLRGEIPGVQVVGKSVLIRGPSSILASTEPLFVVDGVVVSSIDEISPSSVKSIEVLKGSAATIYGSRGANGVILIRLVGVGR
jgi:TonB-dependent SusC/RagA subfamily outer membrane receptor